MVLTAHTRGNRFVPAHKSPTGGTQRPGEGPLARATPTAEPLSPPREPMTALLAGVSIAALAPDAEETSQSQQAQFPTTEIFSHIEIADGRVWMLPKGVDYFVGETCPIRRRRSSGPPMPCRPRTCSGCDFST